MFFFYLYSRIYRTATRAEKVYNILILIFQTPCVAQNWAPSKCLFPPCLNFTFFWKTNPCVKYHGRLHPPEINSFSMIYNCRGGKCPFKDKVCLKDKKLQAHSTFHFNAVQVIGCVALASELASLVSSSLE